MDDYHSLPATTILYRYTSLAEGGKLYTRAKTGERELLPRGPSKTIWLSPHVLEDQELAGNLLSLSPVPEVRIGPLTVDPLDVVRPLRRAFPLLGRAGGGYELGAARARISDSTQIVILPEKSAEKALQVVQIGVVDPAGKPMEAADERYKAVVTAFSFASKELIERLDANPRLLHGLTPRVFEELVAELLSAQGFEVWLSPATRDGGFDIRAAKKNGLGSFLYLVECKKYAPHRPVRVGLVRNLYGVVESHRATAGIVATTSFFTKPAREFQATVGFRMSLQDLGGIQSWIKGAR